jgi:hypothetical protein
MHWRTRQNLQDERWNKIIVPALAVLAVVVAVTIKVAFTTLRPQEQDIITLSIRTTCDTVIAQQFVRTVPDGREMQYQLRSGRYISMVIEPDSAGPINNRPYMFVTFSGFPVKMFERVTDCARTTPYWYQSDPSA